MECQTFDVKNYKVKFFRYNTVVVGTGAAGYNAANCLYNEGQKDIAIVTENILTGTSRNTGSDKQTYYKLTLAGAVPDSVLEMANTLFDGGCVDGDIALCEAALSTETFFNLVGLGVPFPRNRYGEYIGYKTDHDPRTRATSVGPYTSRIMTEMLERSVTEKDITVFNKFQLIKLITDNNKVIGFVCFDTNNGVKDEERFVLFGCKSIIYATGGPGGIYSESVYPFGHYGSSGLAFEAGALGKNLTEWQYGLASLKPRWNVSGTYMQVLPRFVSTDMHGGDEREFLLDYFNDRYEMLDRVFLKGYQWPFDVRKVDGGSSIIDILVYMETEKGRRVYLDFRDNCEHKQVDFQLLSEESREYLYKASACFGTPYERLCHMNMPAVEFYRDRGVDLGHEMLEIALCAQHNNGGLAIDSWWQTSIENLFAVGEVAASHGVYRPGGSALNAGQVGGVRAARYITMHGCDDTVNFYDYQELMLKNIEDMISLSRSMSGNDKGNVKDLLSVVTKEMSRVGGAIREKTTIDLARKKVKELLDNFSEQVKTADTQELSMAFRLRDILIAQYVYLGEMSDYIESGGKSRGSALYTDIKAEKPDDKLPDKFNFTLDDGTWNNKVREVLYTPEECKYSVRNVRPIPCEDNFFENIWRRFREDKNVY